MLRDYQAELFDKLRNKMANGWRKAVLALSTGGGKCLGFNTPIIMSDGSIKMVQDIMVGDRVLGPDSKARNVLSITRGHGEMFRVIPIKGDPYICNADHILSLKKTETGNKILTLSNKERVEVEEKTVNVRVDEFMTSNKTAKHCLKGWRANAIEFPDSGEKEFAIPPYILGAWLGDGTSKITAITKPHCKMIEEWISYCESLGLKVRIYENTSVCPTYVATNGRNGGKPNILLDKMRSMNVIDNKHIPDNYMTASIADRLELIAGLLDSDGYLNRSGYDWISVNKKMAYDFAFVIRSVGLACYVSECQKKIKDRNFVGTYWRCSISGDCERIPCRDKKSPERKQKKRHLVHGINIESIGINDYYGFELDGDGLFLLGDFTVTHNSAVAIEIIKSALAKGKRAAFCVDRIVLVEQFAQMAYNAGVTEFSILQADNPFYRPHLPFQIMTVQTMARRDVEPFDLVINDECHIIHKTLLEKMTKWEKSFWIGLTATPYTRGLGKYWNGLVTGITMSQLIEQGYLSNYDVYGPASYEPDLNGVKTVGDDYNKKQLAERTDQKKLIGDMVEHYQKLIPGKRTMVMAVNIPHAEHIAQEFNENGIKADFIHCYLDADEIKAKLARFKNGETTLMSSVDMLSRGFDMPNCEAIIVGRPTKSVNYHIQALGRVLRIADGKERAIILDHAGNVKRLGFPCSYVPKELNAGEKKETKKIDKEKLPKECPQCHVLKPAGQYKCPKCGFEPKRKPGVVTVGGDLVKLQKERLKEATPIDKDKLYAKLLAGARAIQFQDGWAAHKYREFYGVWPHNKQVQMDRGFFEFLKKQNRGVAIRIVFSLIQK